MGAPEKDANGNPDVGILYVIDTNTFDYNQTISVSDNPLFPHYENFGYAAELSGDHLAVAAIYGDKYDAASSSIIDAHAEKVDEY